MKNQKHLQRVMCPDFISDILRQCKTNASRVAVIDKNGRRRSTYGEFYELIQRASGYIKAKGIVPGSFIVVNMANSLEYLAVEYGAWLAGCAIAPVNPLYPKARIDYITEHCEAPLVVDEIIMEEIRQTSPLEICETTADIAALFYTSGSTGKPKGVIHTFESLSHVDRFSEVTDVYPDDCYGIGSPFSFLLWIFTIPFLRAGASLWLIERELMTDIPKLQDFFDNNRITGSFVIPSVLEQLDMKNNKHLRFLMSGAERISNMKAESSYQFINIYGMTETAGFISHFDIDKAYSNTPIGKPTSDIELKLMDDGEICLRGALSPGYYKDPEQSAALWEGGWFHTGDIGRMLPDGNIEYVDRKDWMVKITGQRVETGEIIHVIKEMDGVSNATAKAFTSDDGHPFIVAYYVADDSITEDAVREFISLKLATYMIPSYFVKLDALPHNANGKVDRLSLPLPDLTRRSSPYVAPEGELETSIQTIVSQVLFAGGHKKQKIGVTDNLLSAGMTSMKAMIIASSIGRELKLNIAVMDILQKPTIRDMAAMCQNVDAVHPLQSADRSVPYPLLENQKGVFIQYQAGQGYNTATIFRFKDIDVKLLSEAVKTAIDVHPAFKIRLVKVGSEVMQQSFTDETAKVSVFQLDTEPDAAFFDGRIRPFDLFNDDLYRAEIYNWNGNVWLFFDTHHIVFDGYSQSVLMRDIMAAYHGRTIRQEEITLTDWANFESQLFSSDRFARAEEFFSSYLEKAHSMSLRDSASPDGVTAAQLKMNFSSESIIRRCEKCCITVSSFMNAAFAEMLRRLTHEENPIYLTISNGREYDTRLLDCVGFFVKTLPVVAREIDHSHISVDDYLSGFHRDMMQVIENNCYPFTRMAEQYDVNTDLMFLYQGKDDLEMEAVRNNVEIITPQKRDAIFPILMSAYPKDGGMEISVIYDGMKYGRSDMQTFIDAFAQVAQNMAEAEMLDGVEMLSPSQKVQVINASAGKELPYDTTKTWVDHFRERVIQMPDAVALIDRAGSITYRELDSQSDRVAGYLLSLGVKVDDFVAIILGRKKEFILSVLAINKVGAAYLPIDDELPQDRIDYMLQDSGAAVIITEENLQESLSWDGNTDSTMRRTSPENYAYMIYTSGSTGRPKGVVVKQKALMAFAAWRMDDFKRIMAPGEVYRRAAYTNFCFDASIDDVILPIIVGGEVHILDDEIRKDLSKLHKYICDHQITGTAGPTQLGMSLVNQYPDTPLKFIMMGGEKMLPCAKTKIMLSNGYGPTEFTISSCYHWVNQDVDTDIPMGRPVPNTWSFICDKYGHLLPHGMVGEICLVGPQMSEGYWKQPEKTAQSFVDCQCMPGEIMYRTGDLARYDTNDELVFFGRIDFQVKFRGFRIELGEIENRAAGYEHVVQVSVLVKDNQLVLFYTADKQLDVDGYRGYMAQTLPDYMVPTVYMQLESMPVTTSCKVDKKALAAMHIQYNLKNEPPKNDVEEQILKIASEIRPQVHFGVTDNLLDVGFSSITIMKLAATIESRLGISFSISQIIRCGSIRAIIQTMTDKGSGQNVSTGDILSGPQIRDWNESVSETIEVVESREYYPLTDNQLGIYIDWEQHRDGLQYNVPSAMKIIGMDAEKMMDALKKVISNHPYLKARITQVKGEIVQQRRDDADIPVLSGRLEEEPSTDFFQSRVRPFNLLKDDLARFEVWQSETAAYLFFDIHHIIYDGSAAGVFLSDLTKILSGSGMMKPEKVSAFDYAVYYDNWKRSDRYVEYEKYFDELISGTESFLYPVSRTNLSTEGKSASMTVSVPLEKIRSFCRGLGITENAYFATVLTQVFHRVSRVESIQIATISSGRSMEQLSDTMGMFVQTLPLVSRKSRGVSADILLDMQSQIINTIRRDKYPFIRLSERHGLKPNVFYAYQGNVIEDGALSGLGKVEFIKLSLDTVKIPLSVNVIPDEVDYSLVIEYDKGMYSEEDMSLLCNALSVFAVSLAETSPEKDISSVGLASSSEVSSLIALGTGEKLDYDRSETFIDMFLRNVSATPDAAAVVDYRSSLTYRELDVLSDALAAKLATNGVGTGDFVAVKLPRVKEFIVAVLGIWKAGGAYVPIDPEYPEDRINYMLEDSGAKVVIDEGYCTDIAAGNKKRLNLSRPENPAYMIYTSGSTGKPKGVVVTHLNLWAFLAWMVPTLGLQNGDAAAEYASFSFDGSCLDLYPAISAGGALHILSEQIRKDVPALVSYLVEHQIKGMFLPTKFAQAVLESNDLPLEYLIMGGENNSGVRKTSTRIYEMYGPTEFTVASSFHIIDSEKDGDRIPIGRPVPNSFSLIVDAYGNILPSGMAGELCLSGDQLTAGYWHRPELTEKVFVPCEALGGAKIYRTGDLARWNENGELEYLGRIDHQVKLRGFRIEMGEIEAALSKFAGVISAVAEVKTVNDIQHLCAYYVSDAPIDENTLKSELSKSLTEYMIPDAFMRLESLPLTPGGKVDRKALPEPEFKSAEMVPPATREEEILLRIARELLGTDGFGVTDSLVEYGMNSIAAIKFVAAASKEGISLKMGHVLQNPTVRAAASSNQTFGYWYHRFDTEKPVFVFTIGFTPWNDVHPLLETLSRHYNLFVFEAFRDHFEEVFSGDNIDEVIRVYTEYLERMLPQGVKVNVFGGHCIGGDVALRMACAYSSSTGRVPSLFLWDARLLDTILEELSADSEEEALHRLMNVSFEQTEVYDELIRSIAILRSLVDGMSESPSYDGQSFYFNALQDIYVFLEESRRILSAHLPNMHFIDIDANHFSILSAEKSKECLGTLDRFLTIPL